MTNSFYASVSIFFKQTHEPSPEHPLAAPTTFWLTSEVLKIFTDSLVDDKLQYAVIEQLDTVAKIRKNDIKSIAITITE